MLDVSDFGNARWYITVALCSISLGLTLIPQENNARANVGGISKGQQFHEQCKGSE